MSEAAVQLRLTDLKEDLLIQIGAHCAADDPLSLLRLGASTRLLRRVFVLDGTLAALAWRPAVRRLGWPCDDPTLRPASPMLYRALSSVSAVTWEPVQMQRKRIEDRLITAGVTGVAVCRLDGSLLLFGGTLNGNYGPILDELLLLQFDGASATGSQLSVQSALMGADDSRSGSPGPRRGHTLTATTLADGTDVAVLLGGWGVEETTMTPWLLTARPTIATGAAPMGADDGVGGDGRTYTWSQPHQIVGEPPPSRAFHSTTEVAPGQLLVYGGLGSRSCHTDVAILDLHRMRWSHPTVEGTPSCEGGRAGHGAVFFRDLDRGNSSAAAGGGAAAAAAPKGARGELLLLAGASRSAQGDSHHASIDSLEVQLSAHGQENSSNAVESLRWSNDATWAGAQLPAVRTASYAVVGRSVLAWGGINETQDPEATLHVIDVDRRRVREIDTTQQYARPLLVSQSGPELGPWQASSRRECPGTTGDQSEALLDANETGGTSIDSAAATTFEIGSDLPAPRGGAVCTSLGPGAGMLLLCGSGHPKDDKNLTPWVLRVAMVQGDEAVVC